MRHGRALRWSIAFLFSTILVSVGCSDDDSSGTGTAGAAGSAGAAGTGGGGEGGGGGTTGGGAGTGGADIDAASAWQFLFPVAAVALVAGLWWWRRALGRGPLVAVLLFGVLLGPALGFVNVYPMRFSFVADHFQYVASAPLLALFAAGVSTVATGHRAAGATLSAAAMVGQLEALVDRANDTRGGSSEIDASDVAVKPTGPAPASAVMMTTPAAYRRNTAR